MGAGSSSAGSGPAGFDPVASPSAPPGTLLTGGVPFYDPATRSFPRDANGALILTHPATQAAAFILTNLKGTIKSLVDAGIDRNPIDRANAVTVQAAVDRVCRSAVAKLVASGDIAVRSVTAVRTDNGTAWDVDIANLREPNASRPVRVTP